MGRSIRRSFIAYAMVKYVICKHTCSNCVNRNTKSILWPSGHNTAQRHACNPGPHKSCTRACPGNKYLSSGTTEPNGSAVRDATQDDIDKHLHTLTPFDNASPAPTSIPDDISSFRKIEILYVADPVLAETNLHRARKDLGFISTNISQEEWLLIKHMEGHVHRINPEAKQDVKVVIQEWVR